MENTSNQTHLEKMKIVAEKIKDVKIAMLSTVSDEKHIHSRPMYTQQIKEDGIIWFFSSDDEGKIEEIRKHNQVNLNYSDPSSDLYVSVSGKALVTKDASKIDELWKESLKAWFPKGKSDPAICLIRVDVEEAEYWDTPDMKVVQLIGYLKARITGKEYHAGEHEKIDL